MDELIALTELLPSKDQQNVHVIILNANEPSISIQISDYLKENSDKLWAYYDVNSDDFIEEAFVSLPMFAKGDIVNHQFILRECRRFEEIFEVKKPVRKPMILKLDLTSPEVEKKEKRENFETKNELKEKNAENMNGTILIRHPEGKTMVIDVTESTPIFEIFEFIENEWNIDKYMFLLNIKDLTFIYNPTNKKTVNDFELFPHCIATLEMIETEESNPNVIQEKVKELQTNANVFVSKLKEKIVFLYICLLAFFKSFILSFKPSANMTESFEFNQNNSSNSSDQRRDADWNTNVQRTRKRTNYRNMTDLIDNGKKDDSQDRNNLWNGNGSSLY
eukprot:TRINITY_DN2162_c0_g1_i1.p1 TRINITY_DN2162_c0_g1~~TRINITY_DN2162_c0_g1_i1.p1  ORF type:complete len:347 (+),score=82.04 TRINITY_DN2162_c0_g1_i1:40-1041(+)